MPGLLRPARPARPSPVGDPAGADPQNGGGPFARLPGPRASLLRPDRLRGLLGGPPSPEPRSRPQRRIRDHLRPRLPADRGGRDLVDGVCRRAARPPRSGGSVRERLPGPHPCSGLHRPRAGGAAARGAGAGARQAPFRGVLRTRLPPSVRAGVRAQRVRGADFHHGDQAVRGGPRVRGGDTPVVRGKRRGPRAQGGGRRRRRVRIVGRRHARAARGHRHGVRSVRGTRRDDAVRRGGVPVSRGCAPRGRDADPCPGSALPGRDHSSART